MIKNIYYLLFLLRTTKYWFLQSVHFGKKTEVLELTIVFLKTCFLGEEFSEKEDENDFCVDSEIEEENILEKESQKKTPQIRNL